MKILRESQYNYLESHKRLNRNIFLALLIGGIILCLVKPLLFILSPLPLVASVWFLRQYFLWEAGIKGEKEVVATLKQLDDSYLLLNDIKLPSKQGNIDHILLSPKGVFVIETKNYTGAVSCYQDEWYRESRKEAKPIGSVSKQVKRNALELRNFLRETAKVNTYVNPVCVFTNPSIELTLYQPTVPILQLAELTTFFDQVKPSISITKQELQIIAQSILKIP